MRLLILTADYPPKVWSGIGVAVERQARALASLGIEVHVLVASETEFETREDGCSGPFIHHLSQVRCPVDPGQFDIVHLHSLGLAELGFELRRRFGLPLVYTAHSLLRLELENSASTAQWCAVQDEVLASSDHVIFPGPGDRSIALDWWPSLAARSSVIPNGVPPPPDPLPPLPADGPIVFAGRFARNKGIELLAELIPCVLGRRPSHFVLAGGHGDPLGTRIARDIAARCPEACQVVGWLGSDELNSLFGRAALVLVPSLYEPFGQTALEALRVGAPVVAAAVGGLVQVVHPCSGGRLVYGRDPEEWCDSIIQVLSDPAAAQKARDQGPKHVASRFNITRIAERLREQVYAA